MGVVVYVWGELVFNADNGAETIMLGSHNAWHHHISIDSVAASGTLAVEGKPLGATYFKTIADVLDLADTAKQQAVFEGLYTEFRLTPVGMPASTDYVIVMAGYG